LKQARRAVPRAPFVVTVTLLAAGACGGKAFDDTGAGGSSGSGSGGSSGNSGAGGSGGGGAQPGCPPTTPAIGAPCVDGTVCSYSNGPCCPPTETRCVERKWQVLVSTCNPPPPRPCPDTPPLEGSSCGPVSDCSSSFQFCSWDTCGDGAPDVTATCSDAVWHVQANGCPTPDCSAEFQALADYAHANRQCTLNEQCTARVGPCSQGADFCDGTFYVNLGVDDAVWSALTAELRECMNRTDIDCATCDAIAPPAMCVNGACQGSFGL
jgi:hypothetical protein